MDQRFLLLFHQINKKNRKVVERKKKILAAEEKKRCLYSFRPFHSRKSEGPVCDGGNELSTQKLAETRPNFVSISEFMSN